jgi:hypothetical protein
MDQALKIYLVIQTDHDDAIPTLKALLMGQDPKKPEQRIMRSV